MPNFKSISFKMAVLQGGGQNLPPPHVCVIQKTPCEIGLNGELVYVAREKELCVPPGCSMALNTFSI